MAWIRGVEVEDARLDQPPPAEREQLGGQDGRPLGRLRDGLDAVKCRRAIEAAGRRRRQVLREHLRIAADREQHVVEVVRDAAGEAPDRLELLRLEELALGGSVRVRAVMSTTVAKTWTPSSVSTGDRLISTGNSVPSLRRPARSRPMPIGRAIGWAMKPSRCLT